jgi:chromosome segregation ATPase
MMSDAVSQLRAVHAQLQVAESHIASMGVRDDALVARMREAEKMLHQARASAEKNDSEVQKMAEMSKAAEARTQRAEQRAFAAQESLANLNRRLQSLIGQGNKWRYQQLGVSASDTTPEEAHLQVLNAILSSASSAESSSAEYSRPHTHSDSHATALREAETRITELTHQLSQSNTMTASAQADVRTLTDRLSASKSRAEFALNQTKQQLEEASVQASTGEARILELETQLSHLACQTRNSETRLCDAEERVIQIDAQAREGQKALTAAVLQCNREADERRAAQLALENTRRDKDCIFVVPALMDALRMIARHSA